MSKKSPGIAILSNECDRDFQLECKITLSRGTGGSKSSYVVFDEGESQLPYIFYWMKKKTLFQASRIIFKSWNNSRLSGVVVLILLTVQELRSSNPGLSGVVVLILLTYIFSLEVAIAPNSPNKMQTIVVGAKFCTLGHFREFSQNCQDHIYNVDLK